MAKLILCGGCKEGTQKNAEGFGEYFISLTGDAKKPMNCDQCGMDIEEGDVVHACCLLNSSTHFNADAHNPKRWAGHYIEINK
jgi:hypothetical protein